MAETRLTKQDCEYERLLEAFSARERPSSDCVRYLCSLGFTNGQARSAVFRYRQRHELTKQLRRASKQ